MITHNNNNNKENNDPDEMYDEFSSFYDLDKKIPCDCDICHESEFPNRFRDQSIL